MFTNKGLAQHAKLALAEKWGYVYGTFGQTLTPALFAQKLGQYPIQNGRYEAYIRSNYVGRRVTDCVGLMKSYLWWNEGKVRYSPLDDLSANMAYEKANRKGPLVSIPNVEGICVWRQGHIGVYMGDGFVIEAKGTMHGVVRTPLVGNGSNHWQAWLEYPGIKYLEEEPDWIRIIRSTASSPEAWIEAVKSLSESAKTRSPVIVPSVCTFLPELIVKLNSRK